MYAPTKNENFKSLIINSWNILWKNFFAVVFAQSSFVLVKGNIIYCPKFSLIEIII